MKALDGGRINIGALCATQGQVLSFHLTYTSTFFFLFCSAACSVGAAQACFELARDHVQVRKAFGAPLSANQVPSSLSVCRLRQ
jgi:hypothetical protein